MLAASGKIVVIASDLGLRQSLTFALEVEGYPVEAHDAWDESCVSVRPVLCVIVDDQALRSRDDARQYLAGAGHPVILLTDGISPPLEGNFVSPLIKPFEGADLVDLVKRLAQPV